MPNMKKKCCCRGGIPCEGCSGIPPKNFIATFADVDLAFACVICGYGGIFGPFGRMRVMSGSLDGEYVLEQVTDSLDPYYGSIPYACLWRGKVSIECEEYLSYDFGSDCDTQNLPTPGSPQNPACRTSTTATIHLSYSGGGFWTLLVSVIADLGDGDAPANYFQASWAADCATETSVDNLYLAPECFTSGDGGDGPPACDSANFSTGDAMGYNGTVTIAPEAPI